MAAPATQGRLCTTLEEMQIGDYIKCEYVADTANVAGEFLNLGTSVSETELPVVPGTTANGYFYFIKVDKGLLVADRIVQQQISWDALNSENYIMGKNSNNSLLRVLSCAEWDKYISNSNLDGMITLRDKNVWHGGNHSGYAASTSYSSSARYTTWEIFEITSSITNSVFETKFHENNQKYNTNNWLYFKKYEARTSVIPITYARNIAKWSTNSSGYLDSVYFGFRPALEYIDNKKSKTIWY